MSTTGYALCSFPNMADAHGWPAVEVHLPRTDASGRLYLPSGASPLRQMRLRRRTAGEWLYRLAAPRRCNGAARQVRPARARRPAEKGGLKGPCCMDARGGRYSPFGFVIMRGD
jgi:hypothetical protein